MPNLLGTKESIYRLIRAAKAAPSILNTQPWSFCITADDRIELRAELGRAVSIDSKHREMVISCGAALFNLRMAIRVTGCDPVVWLVPDRDDQDLLASIKIVNDRLQQPTITEQRLYEVIRLRHTTREPFSQPIEMNMAAELAQAARMESVDAWLLFPPQAKRLLRTIAEVEKKLKGEKTYVRELGRWTGPGTGVPPEAFGPLPLDRYPPVRDLGLAWSSAGRRRAHFEKNPQLMVLATETNTSSDWMRTGQALQRLLLTATHYNVTASFLTQSLEDRDRRDEPQDRLWPWPMPWQMIIRVGHTDVVFVAPHEASVKVVDLRAGWSSA
jgi:hypothetical protein